MKDYLCTRLSVEAFAALTSHGIVRGTKLKPFCEGLSRIIGLDNLGADLDLHRGPPSRSAQLRDFSRGSTSFSSSTAPAGSKNSLSSQNLIELVPAGLLFRHFHRFFPEPGS